jgi:hypothetical protein
MPFEAAWGKDLSMSNLWLYLSMTRIDPLVEYRLALRDIFGLVDVGEKITDFNFEDLIYAIKCELLEFDDPYIALGMATDNLRLDPYYYHDLEGEDDDLG